MRGARSTIATLLTRAAMPSKHVESERVRLRHEMKALFDTFDALHGRVEGAGARRDEELFIAELFPVRKGDRLFFGVDAFRPHAEAQSNVFLFIEGLGAVVHARKVGLAQKVIGNERPTEGRSRPEGNRK